MRIYYMSEIFDKIEDLLDLVSEIDSEFTELKFEEISQEAEKQQSETFKLIDKLKDALTECQDFADPDKYAQKYNSRE